MTREEAKEVLQEQIYKCWCESDEKGIDALNVAISLLCQQPCEDCISRAEALKHSYIVYDDELVRHNVVSVEDIEELPTIIEADKAESEDPDCEYYRNMCGGICFAQKCAPRCECRGIKERCDI